MFMAAFLHELGHSSLVWYGRGACNSPRLGAIGGEAGEYIEKAFFGGIAGAEFKVQGKKPPRIKEVGLQIEGKFYILSKS
jgi:hypothetical protein